MSSLLMIARNRYLPFLLICLAGGALYAHTLHAPFYLDDEYAIAQNPLVKDLSGAFAKVFDRRGLSILTFAINYRLHELNVAGYHLANIAIHLAAASVALLLLRRVFPDRPYLQLFGALVFVAHPLQTQGVTYLVQRMTSLSALLFLTAVYLFVRARESMAAGAAVRDPVHLGWYAGGVLAGGLAILAKENAVVLPLALLLFAHLFLCGSDRRWRPLLVYTAPFFVLPAIAVVAYLVAPAALGVKLNTTGHSGLLRSMEGNSPLNYLATQGEVLWIYIRMLFLPYGQALDHGHPVARGLLTLKPIAGWAGLSLLFALGWVLRRRQPAIAFGIGWFFLGLAVESSVIPLDTMFEHRLYLPMFGFAALAAALLALLPRPSWRLAAGVAVVLVLAILTWQRNTLWSDPIALYEDNLRVAPDNERVYFNLGQKYIEAGLWDDGELLIRESIAMNPARQFGYAALKELYLAQDRIDEAIGMLHYGLEHVSEKGLLYNELAFVYGKKGDFGRAIEMLRRGITTDPQVPTTYFNLAQMLMFAGMPDEVEYYLRKTLELDPGHADARAMLDDLSAGRLAGPGANRQLPEGSR